MKIISIDVGMKNLAYCVLEKESSSSSSSSQSPLPDTISRTSIIKWGVIDLRTTPQQQEQQQQQQQLQQQTPVQVIYPTCSHDKRRAKYMKKTDMNTTFYCSKCAEKCSSFIPTREITAIRNNPKTLEKFKMDDLVDWLKAHDVACEPKSRKSGLIETIKHTIQAKYLENAIATAVTATNTDTDTDTVTSVSNPPKQKAHDLDLITYGRNLVLHLDETLQGIHIDAMIIENQISTIASRMKTLQGMITQYFIMKHTPVIEFISASNKLKLFMDDSLPVSTYSDRKKAGIEICRNILANPLHIHLHHWSPVFDKHKKKDDLADSYLQGLWRLTKPFSI
jgi:hypothetical protein